MALEERLGAFPGERTAEERVGVRQGHHEESDGRLVTPQHDLGLPKSTWASPGGWLSGTNTSA